MGGLPNRFIGRVSQMIETAFGGPNLGELLMISVLCRSFVMNRLWWNYGFLGVSYGNL